MNGGPASLRTQTPLTQTPPVGFDSSTVKICLLVFAGYYLGAKLGFGLTLQPRPVSVLWPPNAILLAALLLTPVRVWWIVLLAAFPAHWLVQLQSDVPPGMIFCWFISNSCEALIGAGGIALLDPGAGSIGSSSPRRYFLSLRRFSRTVPVLLSGLGLRRPESLGTGQLLGNLANSI